MSRSALVFAVAVVWMTSGIDGKLCWGQRRVLQVEPVLIDRFPAAGVENFGNRVGVKRSGPTLQPVHSTVEVPLPADAMKVVDGSDAEIAAIQEKADLEIAEIQRKADEEKRLRREKIIAILQELQDKYTRDAKLDEAIAIRDRIRRLKLADVLVYRDPGSLSSFQDQIGNSFHFEVVGAVAGSLWGTEVYTADSTLAVAAVHSGVLKPGQKGIVHVTILEPQDEYEGSVQYGVTSSSFGSYPLSFSVDPWRETPDKPR